VLCENCLKLHSFALLDKRGIMTRKRHNSHSPLIEPRTATQSKDAIQLGSALFLDEQTKDLDPRAVLVHRESTLLKCTER
jgi:hypothetical protein